MKRQTLRSNQSIIAPSGSAIMEFYHYPCKPFRIIWKEELLGVGVGFDKNSFRTVYCFWHWMRQLPSSQASSSVLVGNMGQCLSKNFQFYLENFMLIRLKSLNPVGICEVVYFAALVIKLTIVSIHLWLIIIITKKNEDTSVNHQMGCWVELLQLHTYINVSPIPIHLCIKRSTWRRVFCWRGGRCCWGGRYCLKTEFNENSIV